MKVLSTWEKNFQTAVHSNWASNPGRTALQVIYDTYKSATGDRRRFNDNCNQCILSLLKDCGNAYFKDKAEMEDSSPKAKVEISETPAKVVRKKKVTTKKK